MDILMNLPNSLQFAIQLAIVCICLFYGSKKGGITLGMLGGVGLIVMIFGFGVKPGKPAIDVMLTILAVVVASATLQTSGGLDVMLQIAEKILRKNPKYISILAPITTCTLTVLCGTGHVVYTILPIVYDIAINNNIRPERPMAASSVSAQLGIIASPVSVAVVTLTAFIINSNHYLAGFDGYLDLLKITIPSTYLGVLCVGIFSWFRGKDLDKDSEFQEKIKDEEFKKYVYGGGCKSLIGEKLPNSAWLSMWIFLGAIALVAILGYFSNLRPAFNTKVDSASILIVDNNAKTIKEIPIKNSNLIITYNELNKTIKDGKVKSTKENIKAISIDNNLQTTQENNYVIINNEKFENAKIIFSDKKEQAKPLGMVEVIQIFMLLAGSLIIIFTKTNANNISKSEIFKSGMVALVAVFGISWMADSMVATHTQMIKDSLGSILSEYPWTYAIVLIIISKLVNSQAAALVAFVPLALNIGVNPAIILAFAPACYGYFILPTYPSDLAAIQFDRSGTTRIGRFVINHSFIIPGFIGVITSSIFGYFLASFYGYL